MPGVKLKVGPTDHGRPMTLEDFMDAEAVEGHRYELARGVIEVTEVPNDPHGQIVHNLHEVFSEYLRHHPKVFRRISEGSGVQLLIPEWESERHPDLAVIFRDTELNARGRRMPRLVIEVVSPGRQARERDYQAKREEYLTFGIEEYWIVDPKSHQVTVLCREEPAAWSERLFQDEDLIISSLLADLVVPVSSLWMGAEE